LVLGNWGARASHQVWRHEHEDEWVVDTCATQDGGERYETAVRHLKIENGVCVIVEEYDSAEAAQKGHERWVEKLKATPIAELVLVNVSTSPCAKLCDATGGTDWRTKRARD